MKHPFSRLFGVTERESVVSNNEMQDQQVDDIKEKVRKLPLEKIIPNRFQPRTIFDEEKIEELAKTIHTHGMIQPIVVRSIENDHYEIIAGERRYRAVKKLGWDTIPAILKDFNDKETASVALIENLQREELSPIEEAMAYNQLLEIHGLTQEALAQRLGKSQSTIANKLRLLKLPKEVHDALLTKEVTERHARALIPLKDAEKQVKLLNEIIEKHLNVKQTEARVERLLSSSKPKKRKRISFSKDVRIAVNTIRKSLEMVQESGINADAAEEELDDYYQITIRIPKKKS
ncbi:nucleoid occlusion protein [Caldibacillus thermolactis]|jgi:ParB family transcriptional regulator, chromosome partitioning protein|uniref:Nucleoid occlusion protein n=1 Tax=Pallidibacillus thermolactis TaxID=251051 RepID=A0ABT2WDX4_9BACI|nr:nucleoid occlusion protein [Pallidibacillus thermolactis]MCU9593865.1 nucleoid occlusion protein [Pallidibacillus thermolactis]MCU9602290.1 nucleoid occlusion protein [Pallidibacillus thermolactis subsp. kokeshiiformis]MED1673715.1 nucleoid occlusion protein [Pallidibacillus thermolactis subsp. kokeshiiformis]